MDEGHGNLMQLQIDEKGRLTCLATGCKLPFLRLQGKCLIIESRHRGETHTNVVSLEDLIRLCEGSPVVVG